MPPELLDPILLPREILLSLLREGQIGSSISSSRSAATTRCTCLYAAAGARPVELYLDGKLIGPCCSGTTGTWNTSGAKWEEAGKLPIAVGKHTIKLQREAAFPHIVSLRFDAPVPLPPEWTPTLPPPRKAGSRAPAVPLREYVAEVNVAALRRAIEDLTTSFGARYPRGPEFLQRLAGL